MSSPLPPPLLAWFRRHRVSWAGLRFEVAEGRGVYGVAEVDLNPGSVVVAVPKAAMLTRKNVRDANALHALLALGLPSVEVLGLAIALERAAGKSSKWHAYLQSLPLHEPLPLLWSAAELRMLAGTGLDETSQRRKRRLLENYRSAVEEWEGAAPLPSSEEYLRACTLSSSRAFLVDGEHGEGLEVCHTYGPLGNWELLAGYGFALQALEGREAAAAVAGALARRRRLEA
ncbi:hypothetical protein EMIHUDRAFT_200755 [Emiliania huxleyi CCMP1516]|uniref:SET domain-containing protein n=2 Tax=Emiliania huxleyi TaxID=2903 RepID=A0A0D3KR37_EMIH1|nr:hypothetical protein EMIHUDRAFT_200755 [Emiliania huxleyi CCMP1516]EOD38222.1 hypothetical protein EMIHUDRAFT_200755 [Emiliania huxleyi CCMP1516]|eukprot:XP_005790651.1 hypothetical protein EMIHUDRAFT_200755 [Emiliania huxleyi CCMP1516]